MLPKSRLTRRCLLMIGFSTVLLGCTSVGPDFVRPTAPLSDRWLDSGDNRVQQGAQDFRQWWAVFHDPVLDRLIETAYGNNLSLQVAGVRVLEARAQLAIAVGDQYPQTQQLAGLFEYQRLSDRAPVASGKSSSRPADSYVQSQIGAEANWEIDFWGKFRRAVESADAGLLSAIASYDNALVSLTASVADNYVQLRTSEERLNIARNNAETQAESLALTRIRFQGGTTTQRDVEQAQTVYSSTLATIPLLEKQIRQYKNTLCILIGNPPSDLTDMLSGASGIPSPPPEVVVGIPADLLRRRPDIRAAELDAASQCAKIGVAKADLYPAFSLVGSVGLLSSDAGAFSLGDMFQWKSGTATVGPTLTWNVLNYGRITNNVRFQDAKFQELVITYRNTVLTAQKEVEDYIVAFLKSQERAKLLADSAAAADRSLQLATLQYSHGTTDFTTVLTAQQTLLAQQDSLAQGLGEIAGNLVGVYRALGGGWEVREGRDFLPASVREAMAERTNWGSLLKATSLEQLTPPGEGGMLPRKPDW